MLSVPLTAAHATDVATSKILGGGMAIGYPYLNITAEYSLDDRAAIVVDLATSGSLPSARGAYQRELAELGRGYS